jgi:hypothetical protein
MAANGPLPRAIFAECLTLGKAVFAECLDVPSVLHSVNQLFTERRTLPSAVLGKVCFAECPIKSTRQSLRHSAKARIPVVVDSGSDSSWFFSSILDGIFPRKSSFYFLTSGIKARVTHCFYPHCGCRRRRVLPLSIYSSRRSELQQISLSRRCDPCPDLRRHWILPEAHQWLR